MSEARNNRSPTARERRHRLSVRLLILFLVTGVVLVAIIASMFGGAWRYRFEELVIPHLEQYVAYLQSDIGSPPDIDAASRLAARLPVDIVIHGQGVRWTSLGRFPDVREMRFGHGHRIGDSLVETGEYGRDRYVARVNNDGYELIFVTAPVERGGRGSAARWLTIVLVLLVLAAAYYTIRRMLQPIQQLEIAAARLGGGELDARTGIDRRDELGALSASFDHMADRIQRMLDAKRELLLAISHELRSPLTRANVSAELVDDPSRRQALKRDLGEMERLIAELLEAERLNADHAPLNLERARLSDLVTELVAEQFGDAPIRVELPREPLELQLDIVRVKLMLRNLLDNALRHNRTERGPVTLTGRTVSEGVQIVVEDHGEGFTSAEMGRVGEAFWRRDAGRARSLGGFGLGLYLSRQIALAHGGRFEVDSVAGEWARITVTLSRDAPGTSTR